MGSLSSWKKSEFLKLVISFFHYFWCQNGDQWKVEVEKIPIYIFSTFGSKINEFEQKKLEKTEKIPKTQKVAGKYMAVARSENPGGGL